MFQWIESINCWCFCRIVENFPKRNDHEKSRIGQSGTQFCCLPTCLVLDLFLLRNRPKIPSNRTQYKKKKYWFKLTWNGIDSTINYNGIWFKPVSFNKLCFADSNYQNVGLSDLLIVCELIFSKWDSCGEFDRVNKKKTLEFYQVKMCVV